MTDLLFVIIFTTVVLTCMHNFGLWNYFFLAKFGADSMRFYVFGCYITTNVTFYVFGLFLTSFDLRNTKVKFLDSLLAQFI